jgi:hypothetical protein
VAIVEPETRSVYDYSLDLLKKSVKYPIVCMTRFREESLDIFRCWVRKCLLDRIKGINGEREDK